MKNMTKEQINSLIRHICSIIAGILMSKGIIDSSIIAGAIGLILSITSIVWSIKEKTYTLGQIEGTVRQLLTFLSGFLAFKAYLTPETIELWIGTFGMLLPVILGQTDKLWSADSKPAVKELE